MEAVRGRKTEKQMKKRRAEDKVRLEHRHQRKLSIDRLSPQHLAQPAGYETGEFQPATWEQSDMMTSLHKTLQSLQKLTHSRSRSPPCSTFTEAHRQASRRPLTTLK